MYVRVSIVHLYISSKQTKLEEYIYVSLGWDIGIEPVTLVMVCETSFIAIAPRCNYLQMKRLPQIKEFVRTFCYQTLGTRHICQGSEYSYLAFDLGPNYCASAVIFSSSSRTWQKQLGIPNSGQHRTTELVRDD